MWLMFLFLINPPLQISQRVVRVHSVDDLKTPIQGLALEHFQVKENNNPVTDIQIEEVTLLPKSKDEPQENHRDHNILIFFDSSHMDEKTFTYNKKQLRELLAQTLFYPEIGLKLLHYHDQLRAETPFTKNYDDLNEFISQLTLPKELKPLTPPDINVPFYYTSHHQESSKRRELMKLNLQAQLGKRMLLEQTFVATLQRIALRMHYISNEKSIFLISGGHRTTNTQVNNLASILNQANTTLYGLYQMPSHVANDFTLKTIGSTQSRRRSINDLSKLTGGFSIQEARSRSGDTLISLFQMMTHYYRIQYNSSSQNTSKVIINYPERRLHYGYFYAMPFSGNNIENRKLFFTTLIRESQLFHQDLELEMEAILFENNGLAVELALTNLNRSPSLCIGYLSFDANNQPLEESYYEVRRLPTAPKFQFHNYLPHTKRPSKLHIIVFDQNSNRYSFIKHDITPPQQAQAHLFLGDEEEPNIMALNLHHGILRQQLHDYSLKQMKRQLTPMPFYWFHHQYLSPLKHFQPLDEDPFIIKGNAFKIATKPTYQNHIPFLLLLPTKTTDTYKITQMIKGKKTHKTKMTFQLEGKYQDGLFYTGHIKTTNLNPGDYQTVFTLDSKAKKRILQKNFTKK